MDKHYIRSVQHLFALEVRPDQGPGTGYYAAKDVDAAIAAKDAEIAALTRRADLLEADVNSMGLSLVRIEEAVAQSQGARHRPASHNYIEGICNATLANQSARGFQACNVCGDTPLPGTGRCFDHDPRTEHSQAIRDLLHTAFSGIKGGFTLPAWWLPKVRAALSDQPIPGYDEAMALATSDPLPPHPDTARLDWLQERGVCSIRMDDYQDGTIDVRGMCVRDAIDKRKAWIEASAHKRDDDDAIDAHVEPGAQS